MFYNGWIPTLPMDPDLSKAYSQLAKSYDAKWGWFCESAWVAALPLLPDLAGKWVLDAGCGTGLMTDRLSDEVGNWGQVVAIDACQEMLDKAQYRVSDRRNVTLHRAPITAVPARDRSFDLVVCSSVVHMVSDLGPSLKEWRRVLNTNGEVVILDYDAAYWLVSLAHRFWRLRKATYNRAWRVDEVESALKNHGFSIIESRKAKLSLFWCIWLVRARKE